MLGPNIIGKLQTGKLVPYNFFETLGILVSLLLFFIMVFDLLLFISWHKIYYTNGLLVFVMKIPVAYHNSNTPPPSRLNTQFQSFWTSSLIFKEIEPNTYGFREEMFFISLFRYPPQMHGMLFFDISNNQVVVKGFLNWWILVQLILCLGVGLFFFNALFTLGLLTFVFLVFGISFWAQHYRYSNVAKFAAKAWTREYNNNHWGLTKRAPDSRDSGR